jgi:formylglycine-generating enzyme required for sulfatase activity
MGSPLDEPSRQLDETPHRCRIDQGFAIATKEVTVEQFQRFRPKFQHGAMRFCPEPDCPILAITWYEAAEYCNWLNQQEGIPKDQWCYEPNGAAKYAEGMKVVPDWRQRTGYRLPTEAEWEYACRAGAVTGRYHGRSEEMFVKYAWYAANTNAERSQPVGMLKPNDFGLFDMLGNEAEWCQHLLDEPPADPKDVQQGRSAEDTVNDKQPRAMRGSAFALPANFARAAQRNADLPMRRNISFGMRVTRSCSAPTASHAPEREPR